MKWVYVVNYTKKSHGAAKKSTLSRRLVGVLQRAGAVEDERRVADEVAGALELEEQDISGCLQGFYHPSAQSYCYGFVLYDTTPGGAGHVKRLANPALLEKALQLALSYMERCTCGGEDGNASCYACLRAYGNQKIHDKLKRSYVIEFLREIGITPYKGVFIDTAV